MFIFFEVIALRAVGAGAFNLANLQLSVAYTYAIRWFFVKPRSDSELILHLTLAETLVGADNRAHP